MPPSAPTQPPPLPPPPAAAADAADASDASAASAAAAAGIAARASVSQRCSTNDELVVLVTAITAASICAASLLVSFFFSTRAKNALVK